MNPFIDQNDYFFRPYSASRTLQDVVLSLFNDHHPISLGKLRGLDEEHYAVAKSCIDAYWKRGESAPGFLDLATKIFAEREAETSTDRANFF